MDKSQTVAVVVSFFSLAVAALALGWNVYRDVVLKPRLKVRVSVVDVVHATGSTKCVSVTGTNLGPGELIIEMAVGKNAPLLLRLRRKTEHFILVEDYTILGCHKVPKRLLVGERVTLLWPYDKRSFLKDPLTRIGLQDSFGREHWATAVSLKVARASYVADFGKLNSAPTS